MKALVLALGVGIARRIAEPDVRFALRADRDLTGHREQRI